MQPDLNPQQTVTVGQNIPAANPFGEGQVIYVQQAPNSAPTVIGILTCIYGVIMVVVSLLGLIGFTLLMDPSSEIYEPVFDENSSIIWMTGLLMLLSSAGYIFGGVMITKRKKIGVYVTWSIVAISTAINILIELIAPEISASDPNSFGAGFNMIVSIVCAGICGALIAIPLMVQGSNMED
jgi:hypothetical protein